MRTRHNGLSVAARATAVAVVAVLTSGLPVPGQRPQPEVRMDEGLPAALRGIGIEQRLNVPLPSELEFVDESGRSVRIGDYFGERPVILALAYYTCPMLCNQVLQGLTRSLSVVNLEIGEDFEIVTVSFDPRDTSETAAAMKRRHVQRYHGSGAEEGWHFLSGEAAAIERLTEAGSSGPGGFEWMTSRASLSAPLRCSWISAASSLERRP